MAKISAAFFEKFPHLRPIKDMHVSDTEAPTEVQRKKK